MLDATYAARHPAAGMAGLALQSTGVGAGCIGLEMADALITRGLSVIKMEQLPEVLPTVDPG